MISFGRLTDVINNAKGLDYESTLFLVFEEDHIQQFAIDLNTGSPNNSEYGQLFLEGVDAKGIELSVIGGDYSPTTVFFKQFDGLPFDRVTLYQDGDFYKSWEFVNKKGGFTLVADTIKEGKDLRDRWGDDIIGLNNESIDKIIKEVLPIIREQVLSELLS